MKGCFYAEDPAGSGSYIHDLKTVVHMEGHMKFRKGKGIEGCDRSHRHFLFQHNKNLLSQQRPGGWKRPWLGRAAFADSVTQKIKCGNILHSERKEPIGCTWERGRRYNGQNKRNGRFYHEF